MGIVALLSVVVKVKYVSMWFFSLCGKMESEEPKRCKEVCVISLEYKYTTKMTKKINNIHKNTYRARDDGIF